MRDRFNFINGADTLARFAREHPDEFFYDESYAGWFYSRHHFRELVARFPGHERADDAAFRLADPLDGGECEGDVLCYIEGRDNVRGLINFLARFPASEYTGEAVRRANVAFTTRLADEFGGPGDDGMLDAPAVGRLLDEYAATVAGLPAPVRERAQAAIDSARLMLDSLSRARP
jgi:hypothetical protein